MTALYRNHICNVIDASGDLRLETRSGEQFTVDYGDEQLVVDPTDDQVADAVNLAEWYGVTTEAAARLRLMLRGEITVRQWEQLKTS
jgi:hypothetical protein